MHRISDLVLIVAGAIVTVDAAIRVSGAVARRTVGRRADAYRRLDRLAANVQHSYFENVLGPPAFKKTWDGSFAETVYVSRYYFVQCIVDADSQVVAYSVTTRRLRFRPQIPFPNKGLYTIDQTPVRGRLNRTSLDTFGEPTRISSLAGARRVGYSEAHYFGNPGNYQEIGLGINDAAPFAGDLSDVIERTGGPVEDVDVSTVGRLRKVSKPNTYSVSAPMQPLADLYPFGNFGADLDQVRVFAR